MHPHATNNAQSQYEYVSLLPPPTYHQPQENRHQNHEMNYQMDHFLIQPQYPHPHNLFCDVFALKIAQSRGYIDLYDIPLSSHHSTNFPAPFSSPSS